MVNGHCYSLEYKQKISHVQANRLCMGHGARLASFNTLEENNDVIDVVWRRNHFHVKVGLLMPSVELPGTL